MTPGLIDTRLPLAGPRPVRDALLGLVDQREPEATRR
jgi:hypothetical protein